MPKQHYYLPAEWYPQSGVQLTWPHEGTDWQPYLADITEAFIALSGAIADREKLVIATPDTKKVEDLLADRLSAKAKLNISVYPCPSNDTWARDHGAITLIDGSSSTGSNRNCRLLDFKFNGWGKKFEADKDNAITSNLFKQGAFNGELIEYDDFVLEGGSIESDGKGTIMTTTNCLLAANRNQPKTQAEIEQELLERLCAKRVIWINHGQLIGDDTDGHIDTIARFAPNDTIVYMGCDDKADPQYEDLKEMEAELRGLKTMEGEPYNLVRLPMPRPIYDGSDRLPATYANFLVINSAVIVPTYRQPDLDDLAMSLIGNVFPGREVIGIDATTMIRQHGSIHCLTMQFPEGAIKQ